MNILSLLSVIIAVLFAVGALYCLTRDRKYLLNIFAFCVLVLLGIWNFCNAFFFTAESVEEAWMWHHLASIGWTGFIAVTTYYFIILTDHIRKKIKKAGFQIMFYALPVVLLVKNVFGDTTSLATGLVRNEDGIWTYENSFSNVWMWIYVCCLTAYFALSFYLLIKWSLKVKHKMKKHMAVAFVIVDFLTILAGALSDMFFPLLGFSLPPVANICTSLFGMEYFFIILRYDVFNVSHVVQEDCIIEHSTEAIMVIDEEGEILRCNYSAARLLETSKPAMLGRTLAYYITEECYNKMISSVSIRTHSVNGVEATVVTASGKVKQLLISMSVMYDKFNEYIGTVVSLRDITQLIELKEKYRNQSDEYHALAYVDTLTGLNNRRKTFELLFERSEEFKETGKDFFILYMDMDRFKSVNDNYGHLIGDRYLISVAEKLKKCVHGNIDFLGRLSGDEFLMCGYICDDINEYIAKCEEEISNELSNPFIFGDIIIQSGVSVGFAKYSDFMDIDAMVQAADSEMYRIKQRKGISADV